MRHKCFTAPPPLLSVIVILPQGLCSSALCLRLAYLTDLPMISQLSTLVPRAVLHPNINIARAYHVSQLLPFSR